MATFGYPTLYSNGLNNTSQIRRSADMIYQRGETYEIVLTGDTYYSSMEMVVDIYKDLSKIGRMRVVPFDVSQSGSTYTYKFNVRAYDYIANYVNPQHYLYYWLGDWQTTDQQINYNNPYPNIAYCSFKYGYSYTIAQDYYTEFTGNPTRPIYHFSQLPLCAADGCIPSGYTNSGGNFEYIGGSFQLQEKLILPNFDQQIGTTIGTGLTINTLYPYWNFSRINQYLMTYPSTPQESETSRFLTDAPRIMNIQDTENYVLYYLGGQTGDAQVVEADYARFEFYDEDNALISKFSIDLYNDHPTGYTQTLNIKALPCGPSDIENLFSTIAWSGVSYYTVQLCATESNSVANGPICPISEVFYFYLYDNCQPENFRMAFLNMRGAYDYFTFTSYKQESKKIKSQTYESRYFSTSIPSQDRDLGRATKTFATDVDREIVLESDYLNVQQGAWLQQLFMSPQVYEMDMDYISEIDRQDKVYKDLKPLQILSTQVDTITKNHQKMNKYKITVKYADTYFPVKAF
jgi:hypothetical protein